MRRSHPAIKEGELERLLIMLNRDQQQFLVVDQKIVRRSSSQWQSSSARRGNAKVNTTGDSVQFSSDKIDPETTREDSELGRGNERQYLIYKGQQMV